jgi:hypothetical protein
MHTLGCSAHKYDPKLAGLPACSACRLFHHSSFPKLSELQKLSVPCCVSAPCCSQSASGIREGARTGLAALTVGFFFFIALFFNPLLASIPPYATGPALILVGAMMVSMNPGSVALAASASVPGVTLACQAAALQQDLGMAVTLIVPGYPSGLPTLCLPTPLQIVNILKIKWDKVSEGVPAFITMVVMPLTYSIAYGEPLCMSRAPYAALTCLRPGMLHSADGSPEHTQNSRGCRDAPICTCLPLSRASQDLLAKYWLSFYMHGCQFPCIAFAQSLHPMGLRT